MCLYIYVLIYMCIYDDVDDASQNISGGAEILSTSESCGFFPLGALFLFSHFCCVWCALSYGEFLALVAKPGESSSRVANVFQAGVDSFCA